MLFQIFHVLLDVDWLLVQFGQHQQERVVGLAEPSLVGAELRLVHGELLGQVLNQVVEGLVIDNESQNDCLVDISGWELVGIAFVNDLSHFGEVLGYLGRALLNYQTVLVAQLLKEQLVRLEVVQQGHGLVHCLVASQWGYLGCRLLSQQTGVG